MRTEIGKVIHENGNANVQVFDIVFGEKCGIAGTWSIETQHPVRMVHTEHFQIIIRIQIKRREGKIESEVVKGLLKWAAKLLNRKSRIRNMTGRSVPAKINAEGLVLWCSVNPAR